MAAAAAAGLVPASDDVWWVSLMNRALTTAPLVTLCCFVVLDLGSALCLFFALDCSGLEANADFALAYALCKGVLRVPRLALDAAAAAALARVAPPLAAVRVSLLVDAAAEAPASLRSAVLRLLHAPAPAVTWRPTGRAYVEAKRLADSYGLAYMAAKNIIGPVSILATYALLRQGFNLQALLGQTLGAQAGAAGRTTGQMGAQIWQAALERRILHLHSNPTALSSTASTLLFPFVVLGAAAAATRLSRVLPRPPP